MTKTFNKIDKAFILSGGNGERIKLGQKENIKAFIEIDNEQLLQRHIRLIKKNLNGCTSFVLWDCHTFAKSTSFEIWCLNIVLWYVPLLSLLIKDCNWLAVINYVFLISIISIG